MQVKLSGRQRIALAVVGYPLLMAAIGVLIWPHHPEEWVGVVGMLALIMVVVHLPRVDKPDGMLAAWLGLLSVIFFGGLVVLALNLGFSAYWTATYMFLFGMIVERAGLWRFKAASLWPDVLKRYHDRGLIEEDGPNSARSQV